MTEEIRQRLTDLNEENRRKISWQKSVMIYIKVMELVLAFGCISFCLAVLVITNDTLRLPEIRHYLIGVVIISALQVVTVGVGIGSIIKHHICAYASYCILTLALLLSFLPMTIFLYIERQNFVDSFEAVSTLRNSHELNEINDAFSCNNFNSTILVHASELSQCASDWMYLSLSILIAFETSQVVFLSLVFLLSCLLHKSMVEDSAVLLPHNMRWLRRRQDRDEVVLLEPGQWSREEDNNEDNTRRTRDNIERHGGSNNATGRSSLSSSDFAYNVAPSAPPMPSHQAYLLERTQAFVQDLIANSF